MTDDFPTDKVNNRFNILIGPVSEINATLILNFGFILEDARTDLLLKV